MIGEGNVFKENLKAAFTINRKIVNSVIGRDVSDALASYDIPVLSASVSQRVGFAESAASGSTVLEDDPKGSAALEIRALTDEITAPAKEEVAS